jgi:hypothetical protein
MCGGADGGEGPGTGVGEILEWVSHPARERPWATVVLVMVILLASLAAALALENLWWGFVGLLLLSLSMWNYLLPVRFRMDADGVEKKSLFGSERKSWSEVRTWVADRYGVLLSPFPGPSRLAKFRGLSVQFAGNREEVLEFIRDRSRGKPL